MFFFAGVDILLLKMLITSLLFPKIPRRPPPLDPSVSTQVRRTA
jgi:hypothetical protein